MEAAKKFNQTRKLPRRKFTHKVGLLYKGKYVMAQGRQIGEKGILLEPGLTLEPEQLVLISFAVMNAKIIIVRAKILYKTVDSSGKDIFGFEFINLPFTDRRIIREYIAEKTETEAQLDV